jgi:hypothetical protein
VTEAQRRTCTVKVTAEAIEVTADVQDPMELIKAAQDLWWQTRDDRTKLSMGFGPQMVERTGDRHPHGEPIYHYDNQPATAKASNQ